MHGSRGGSDLVLAGVGPTHAGDVWEDVRPTRRSTVPANVSCEGTTDTKKSIRRARLVQKFIRCNN